MTDDAEEPRLSLRAGSQLLQLTLIDDGDETRLYLSELLFSYYDPKASWGRTPTTSVRYYDSQIEWKRTPGYVQCELVPKLM